MKSIKSQFKITKTTKVLALAEENFVPYKYIVYRVTGPNDTNKFFTTKKDAQSFINKQCDKTITTNQIHKFKYQYR
jgi:hypothetical protein